MSKIKKMFNNNKDNVSHILIVIIIFCIWILFLLSYFYCIHHYHHFIYKCIVIYWNPFDCVLQSLSLYYHSSTVYTIITISFINILDKSIWMCLTITILLLSYLYCIRHLMSICVLQSPSFYCYTSTVYTIITISFINVLVHLMILVYLIINPFDVYLCFTITIPLLSYLYCMYTVVYTPPSITYL